MNDYLLNYGGHIPFEVDKNFDKEETIYDIILPYGTVELPEITWTQEDSTSMVVITGNDLNATTIISVTSANKRETIDYYLNFSVRKNDNALLKDLKINGVELLFDSLLFEYVVVFPIGTDTMSLPTIDDIVFEVMDSAQTVQVTQNSKTEMIVLVIAEDATTKNVYQINFEILLSNNTMLKDLKIDGVSLRDFDSLRYEYTYMLLPGGVIPKIEVERMEDCQVVDITYGNIDEATYVYVEAADGSIGVYVINFITTPFNPGEKPSIDDVAWTFLGDGYFQASSLRDNVKIMIYSTDGTRILTENVGLVDPNDDIRLPHDGGTIIYLPNNRQIYIYVFVYDNKVIASGKFVR